MIGIRIMAVLVRRAESNHSEIIVLASADRKRKLVCVLRYFLFNQFAYLYCRELINSSLD